MDKDYLKKKLTSSKVKDYSYSIIFFLTFSFFVFFVIRPNLVNVFSLQEELGKLHLLDIGYENVIKKIINIQTFLETNRSDLYLLDQAISSTPQINKIVQDIEKAASSSGIIVNQIDISKINLKQGAKQTKKNSLMVNMSVKTDFEAMQLFVSNLINQRRLKTLKHIVIDKDELTGSASGSLNIKFELEGYYL